MILAGDIGGTKTILALYCLQNTVWECVKKEKFASAGYECFEKLLTSFLGTKEKQQLKSVCIGVAGPIENGMCNTTNLPWVLKSEEIMRTTGAKHVSLLNDLDATAWGVMGLPDEDFVELNPSAKQKNGNLAVIAAGTGLGEALMVWNNNQYHVVATEGGHSDFAPRNELEIDLLRYLMELHPDHVSYERVVCGQGLVNIYQFLKTINYAAPDDDIELKMIEQDPAAVIGEHGVIGDDQLSVKAIEMFCELYGAEAGNLALKCLPKAGVILAGGIAVKIMPSLQKNDFMRGFLAKGRYKEVLKPVSVKVCLNDEAALLGAKNVAINCL